MDWNLFQQPGPEYRIHPFWFWNGEMDDDQIERQISEMADKGVGGFFVCARQGMSIPYLSQEWFQKVRVSIEAAKKHDMHVWLYDEYPYPSGIAGGEVVLEHPEAKHYNLVHQSHHANGGEKIVLELPWARILSAKAVPLAEDGERQWDQAVDIRAWIGNDQADPIFQKAGLTAYNQKRFFTYRTIYKLVWDVPPGEWEIVVIQEKEIEDFKYYGTFVDPCNRQAIQTFIRMTHDKYAEHFGEYFGTTIKGMFTDETGLLGRMPWSPQLIEYFEQRNGYDLRTNLHALYYADYPDAAKIRYDYYQSVHLLLREVYHEQIYAWCEQHGLQYVAEVPSVRMATQLFSHVPGGDSAHEKLGRSLDWILERYIVNLRSNPKMISSLARQLGRERNLIECFHSVGWSMTLQDAKWMIDRLAALGTNFYNFHAFFYTLNGMTKHDAPPSQFLQNPYWPYFRTLGDYVGRISYVMSTGRAEIRIALLDPTTSCWTHLGNPLHRFRYGGQSQAEKEQLERLTQDWGATAARLLKHRVDYDHLDPELLANAAVNQGSIQLGHAEYDVVVIPPITNLEQGAWEKLQRFASQGGRIIALGLLPDEMIESGSPSRDDMEAFFGATKGRNAAYWEGLPAMPAVNEAWTQGTGGAAYFIPCDGEAGYSTTLEHLLSLLEEIAPQAVKLEVKDGRESLLMQTRQLEDESYAVFISHQEDGVVEATLRMNSVLLRGSSGRGRPLQFYRLDLMTGQRTPLRTVREDDVYTLEVMLEPYEAQCIGWNEAEEAASDMTLLSTTPKTVWELSSEGDWSIHAQADNAIRFDEFQLSIGEENNKHEQQSYRVKAKTLIDQCEDISAACDLPVTFSQMFGTPLRMSLAYPLTCSYQTEYTVEQLPASCRLVMDDQAISGDWTIYVNGHSLTKEQFHRCEVYDYTNIACDVTSLLQVGSNTLRIVLQAEHDWDGVTDALYLMGAFGVEFNPNGTPIMTRPPKLQHALSVGLCPGFPYYAGVMSYSRQVRLERLPSEPMFELRIKDWIIRDAVEVKVNGHSLGVKAWSPYCWQGDTALLNEGDNLVEVMVAGSLAGLLEGTYFDEAEHALKPVQTFAVSAQQMQ